MKRLILIPLLAITFTGCSSSGAMQTLIEQLAFDPDDKGCVEIRGTFDLNPIPMITTNVTLVYKKDTGEGAPSC